MRLLSVDPSISEVGVATLVNGKPIEAYTFRTDSEKPIEQRLRDLTAHFAEVGNEYDAAIVEMPDKFMRFGRQAMLNFGSIQLLHLAIGAIVAALALNPKLKIQLVRVADWKGRGKKAETQNTVRLMTGKKLNNHEADAVLMGVHWAEQHRLRQPLTA